MKILVAEDESQMLRLYRIVLEDLDHTVITSEDGEECLAAYRRALNAGDKFDLVILDYRMPKKNGMEVAKEIVILNPLQKLLMITAFAGFLDLKEKPKNMVIIQKPFDMGELESTIKEFQ